MKCPNCGKDEAHFVPPSLGEEGFFVCMEEVYTCCSCGGQAFVILSDKIRCDECGTEYAPIGLCSMERPKDFNKFTDSRRVD